MEKFWSQRGAKLHPWSVGLMRMATRIRARAVRRAGELLQQLDGRGGDQSKTAGDHSFAIQPTQRQAASDAGMSERQRGLAMGLR